MHQTGGYYLHTRWLNQYNSLPWIIHNKHEICTINLRVNIEHCLNLGLNRNQNNMAREATTCELTACIWRSPSHIQPSWAIRSGLLAESLAFNLRLILGYLTLSFSLKTFSEKVLTLASIRRLFHKTLAHYSVINLSPTSFFFLSKLRTSYGSDSSSTS
jgi:hypothetical protein